MNILSMSLVAFLLLDQLLALTTHFSSGIGLVLFISTLAMSAIPKLIYNNNLIGLFKAGASSSNAIVPILIVVYSVIGASIAPCQGHWYFSLATVILLMFSWKFLQLYISNFKVEKIIEPNHALLGLILIYLCLCLASLGFDLYSTLQNAPTNRPSGLYLEPSHLILYASPLMFAVIGNKETRIFGVILSIFIFVLAFTLTSLILITMIMGSYIAHSLLTRKLKTPYDNRVLVMFLAVLLFAMTLQGSYINHRLQLINPISRSMSTQVYLNGWLLAKATFENTHGIGLGLGAMGCSDTINNQKDTISAGLKDADGKIICVRNGSFLVSKIISELGVLGIFIIGFIIYKLKDLFVKSLSCQFNLMLIGAICLTCTLFFIRGTTYFSAPTIFCLFMVLHYLNPRERVND